MTAVLVAREALIDLRWLMLVRLHIFREQFSIERCYSAPTLSPDRIACRRGHVMSRKLIFGWATSLVTEESGSRK
jgi:hypothetical protein